MSRASEIEKETKERLTNRFRQGYNILFEVELLGKAKNETEYIEALQYVRVNERTALIEVVMQGMLSVTYQNWDGQSDQFAAFGEPLEELLAKGVENTQEPFELQRRRVELSDEQSSGESFRNGSWVNKLFLSPFPEETDLHTAATYGYNPDLKSMMIRAFEVNDKGERKTFQLAIANSNVEILAVFMEAMNIAVPGKSSLELMKLSPKLQFDNVPGELLVIRAARVYDALLKIHDPQQRNFFLGSPITDIRQQKYEAIIDQYELLEKKIGRFVDYLVAFDEKLSLDLNSGIITKDKAIELKEKELIRVWTMASILIRKKKARKQFGDKHVEAVEKAADQLESNPDRVWWAVDGAIDFARPVYYACGGGFMPMGGGLSWGEVSGALGGSASELYTWVCENCGRVHDINVPLGILKERCEGCGASGRC